MKVLAISSSGGHWVQLLRLHPAFEGCDVVFATTNAGCRSQVAPRKFHVIPDATRWNAFGLLHLAISVAGLVLRTWPDVIVSTGAAPGYFAIRFGKLIGARTIWIDSFANVEQLSLSGAKVQKYADLWLTQWPHLASSHGPQFKGAVL